MNLNSFEAVFYTLAFLVPGFICDSVLNAFVRRRRVTQEASLLRFLSLSSGSRRSPSPGTRFTRQSRGP